MSVGFAIVVATVLVLATVNAGFRRVLGYVGLAALALLAVAAMLVVDEQYRWVGLVALLVVGMVVARQIVVHRRPKLPKDGTLPQPGAASAWAQRYQKHLAKILSTEALSTAFVNLIQHPSAEGMVAFDRLLEEELRKEAEWDRQHPGFGIYIKAVGASLAENDADLQLLGAETLEELLNCPEALKRNQTRSIDRHIDFLKRIGRSEEEILFVMKEVLLPWQRDGISPSAEGCGAHGKVRPEDLMRDDERREGERNAAVERAIVTIDQVMSQMRAEAERLGLRPEDMVLTPEGIKPKAEVATEQLDSVTKGG